MPVFPSYTSKLNSTANQFTGFYIRVTLTFNGLAMKQEETGCIDKLGKQSQSGNETWTVAILQKKHFLKFCKMWPENQLQAFPTNIHLLKVNNEKLEKEVKYVQSQQ